MYPGSTIFLDVGTQRDLWPGGAWPLLDESASDHVRGLCALGRELELRSGGVCCAHVTAPAGVPAHCLTGTPGAERIDACAPRWPARVYGPDAFDVPADRAHAIYLGTGCALPISKASSFGPVFAHLLAGVRDAVVFGAGIEFGVAHVVSALLDARVRTHLVIDATGAASLTAAQTLIEGWKRRGLDVLTTATVERLLRRATSGGN